MILCLLASFCACQPTRGNGDTDNSADQTTETNGEAPPSEPLSEDDKIKQDVLALMKKSDGQKDPATLFSFFDGDLDISGVFGTTDGVTSIKRKNALSVVSAGGMKYYGVEAGGFLFYVADHNQGSEVIAAIPLQAGASQCSTVFTVFGIDTGAIYTSESESDTQKLTAEMLTVSGDKTKCTFSKEYMDGLAKDLCKSLGYTAAQTKSFLGKYSGSGVYSVDENKITFDIEFKDSLLGNIRHTTSYSVSGDQKVNAYAFMEYTNPTIGIKTPLTTEIKYKDVVYKDNDPISATIQLKSVSDVSYYDGKYQGAPYISATETVNATFALDCSDSSAPKASATCKKQTKESYQGESWTNTANLTLSIDLSRSSQLSFTEKRDGETVTSLGASTVRFATPGSFSTAPQRVTNAINAYINGK